ncbi:tetratricopeptide repeat protein [Paraburkholderia lycopersici]|uniref:Tetratricopeptide repeat-containing protein n=1 Tax=Paraburkholderia lycopersici TaxID=416944 RepID=A0A1G6PLV2_9BURK|nr:tetratricopeptide repeat protein [Paraburkholderia lycopersici]SDC81242.1 Tetratricopeptide repeat-containing protein [Paraburkholderia lycopersici]
MSGVNGTQGQNANSLSSACPYCGSADLVFKSKVALWECQQCEQRFPGSAGTPANRSDSQATRPQYIFFSYAHDENRELVEMFKADLEKRGHRIWFDAKDIGTWDNWKGSITRGIDSSNMMVAFMSRHALRDPGVCRNEIALGLNRFGTVYPVVLEAALENDIPLTLRELQWPDLHEWRDIRAGNVPGVEWNRWYESHLIELIGKIEGEAGAYASEIEALRDVLRPTGFESRIAEHLEDFVGRQWVFDAYQHWVDHQPASRLFWIKAGPGTGKTALAANLATRNRNTVVANWFCSTNGAALRSPERAVRSLAYQLALRLEDYRVRLLRALGISAHSVADRLDDSRKALDKLNPHELLDLLVIEPLGKDQLIWREHKLVILIDALDEATDEAGNNPLADFIAQDLGRLPDWVGLVVTSRPESAVVSRLQRYRPFELDAQDERNRADLREWYARHLANRPEILAMPAAQQQRMQTLLIERSEGMFLYLVEVERGLHDQVLDPGQLQTIDAGVPGLNSLYQLSFQRRFGRAPEHYEDGVRPLLRLLVAAGDPLPESLAIEVLQWSQEQFHKQRRALGSYVIDSRLGISVFHKTLIEWLTDSENNAFFVDAREGRQAIADVLFRELTGKAAYHVRWHTCAASWLPKWLPTLSQRGQIKASHDLAVYLDAYGRYGDAVGVFRRIAENVSSSSAEIDQNAVPLINFACTLVRNGDLGEAEKLFRRLWAAYTDKGSIPEEVLFGLAYVADALNRLEEAGQLYRMLLEMNRNTLRAADPHMIENLNNLAGVEEALGHVEVAEKLAREAIELVQALPDEHFLAPAPYNTLANILANQRRYAEAEPLYRKALDLAKTGLPSGHPMIAYSLNNLGHVLSYQGQKAEAGQLYRQALDVTSGTLPAAHPDRIGTMANLASALVAQDKYDEAEKLCRSAMDLAEGAQIPAGTLGVVKHTLGNLFYQQGRYAEAEPFYRQALELEKEACSNNDEQMVGSLITLADVLDKQARYSESEPLYRQALALREKLTPDAKAEIATLQNSLATTLFRLGRHEAAEPLYRLALRMRRDALPASSPLLASSLNNLAQILFKLGSVDEAESLHREALALRQQFLPEGDAATAASMHKLATVLEHKAQYGDAERLYREAWEQRSVALPTGHPGIEESRKGLIRVLNEQGRASEADCLAASRS